MLDFEDIGSEISKDETGARPRHDMRKLQHPHAVERQTGAGWHCGFHQPAAPVGSDVETTAWSAVPTLPSESGRCQLVMDCFHGEGAPRYAFAPAVKCFACSSVSMRGMSIG